METGALKSFAGEARRQLLTEVRARLDLVLAEGSTQRREHADVVRKLESAVGGAGGGDAGRGAVVDRVAYTWFNRIVALRFMDANGFTDVGVVSPAADRPDGQPEVLVEAKRGVIDPDVAAPPDAQRIAGLLNGSVTSADPESEAFGLLLAAYCRFWNRSMAFMFEHSADYTELLMPADLLSDESVIARAATVLTPDVCADVEVIGWLYQFYIAERKDEVFAGFKKGKKAGAAEIPAATQLFTPDWIVRYLVENSLGRLWMLNRPDSTLVDRMDYYIAPVDEETDFLRIESPEAIKVMDPACGSGHMLTYAFDLLFEMYEEDGYSPADIPTLILSKNLFGTEIDPRAGTLAAFALTMKARARQRTFFTKHVTPNICVLEPVTFSPDELEQLVSRDSDRDAEAAFFDMFTDADTLGALIRPDETLLPAVKARVESFEDGDTLFNRDLVERARRVVMQAEYLSSRYHVVVANPPYMGSGGMEAQLSDRLRIEYPLSSADLYSVFVERCVSMTTRGGSAALVTRQNWMFRPTFTHFRESLLERCRLLTLAHLGVGAFGSIGGEVVSTAAFVLSNSRPGEFVQVFIRLTEANGEEAKASLLRALVGASGGSERFELLPDRLRAIPQAPLAYWISETVLAAFESGQTLGTLLEPREGMSTGNNELYLRYWFEVSLRRTFRDARSRSEALRSGAKWFPYNKGGKYRKWYGNDEYVVWWANDGRLLRETLHPSGNRIWAHNFNLNYIFKPAVSWSDITTSGLSLRSYPHGFLFDATGLSAFSTDDSESAMQLALGLANTRVATHLASILNPTHHFKSGDFRRFPIPPARPANLAGIVSRAVTIARDDWNTSEVSPGFSELVVTIEPARIKDLTDRLAQAWGDVAEELRRYEDDLNRFFCGEFDLTGEWLSPVRIEEVTLRTNPHYVYSALAPGERAPTWRASLVRDLCSYAVGCMFGRYSLDETGLILANQGDTLREYLARIPVPSFMPDEDNVIPVLADDWFDDDIVERFRLFLRVAFGEEHFEENLRFVEESLGKDIRKYFLTDFYKDHLQRYKKRPIYWMFSSPKGTFNALIYMHRYNPSTVSTVLNEYLREFQAKLDAELANQARIAADPSASARDKARAEKESDKIRKMLAELRDYEHDVLYPLASRQISIDLDDGVKANYLKFGTALKKIPGLEATND